MHDHEYFLRRAIDLAKTQSQSGKNGPFGAIIAHDGEIIGEGWNHVVENNDPTAHAEIIAIRNAGKKLNTYILDDCTIYSSCEPCPMCLAAIYWAHIPTLIYACTRHDANEAGFDDEKLYQELSLNSETRQLNYRQMLRDEGRAVLQQWINNPYKIPY